MPEVLEVSEMLEMSEASEGSESLEASKEDAKARGTPDPEDPEDAAGGAEPVEPVESVEADEGSGRVGVVGAEGMGTAADAANAVDGTDVMDMADAPEGSRRVWSQGAGRRVAASAPLALRVDLRRGDGCAWPGRRQSWPSAGALVALVVPGWAHDVQGGATLSARLVEAGFQEPRIVVPAAAAGTFSDKEVDAVLWTAGEEGCAEAIRSIDFGALSSFPKFVLLDAGADLLGAAIHGVAGVVARRAPRMMGVGGFGPWSDAVLERLSAKSDEETEVGLRRLRRGTSSDAPEGVLVGGDLFRLAAHAGAPWLPASGGAVAVLSIPAPSEEKPGAEFFERARGSMGRLEQDGFFHRNAAVVIEGLDTSKEVHAALAKEIVEGLRSARSPVFVSRGVESAFLSWGDMAQVVGSDEGGFALRVR